MRRKIVEDEVNKASAVTSVHGDVGCKPAHSQRQRRATLSLWSNRLRMALDAVWTVLKYPFLLGLFAFDVSIVIPLCIGSVVWIGAWALVLLFVSQTPVWVLFAMEVRRKLKMLPKSEAWETSPERWQQALEEYAKMLNEE